MAYPSLIGLTLLLVACGSRGTSHPLDTGTPPAGTLAFAVALADADPNSADRFKLVFSATPSVMAVRACEAAINRADCDADAVQMLETTRVGLRGDRALFKTTSFARVHDGMILTIQGQDDQGVTRSAKVRFDPAVGNLPPETGGWEDAVDAAVASHLGDRNAIAIGIVAGGRMEVFGYGDADGRGTKPDGSTVFEIGSITKTFIGTAVAQLATASQLSVYDNVTAHLTGLTLATPSRQDIKLGHLLTHTSGIPSMMTDNGRLGTLADEMLLKTSDFYTRMQATRLEQDPGNRFEYSNSGAALAGYLGAAVDRKSWFDMVRDRVLMPANMRDTSFVPNAGQVARKAQGHGPSGAVPSDLWREDAAYGPAGGLHSTIDDMMRYIAAHLGGSQAFTASHALLQRGDGVQSPAGDGMGFLWFVKGDGTSDKLVYHSGATAGFESELMINTSRQIGVIILTNTYGAKDSLEELANRLMEIAKTPR